jgi:hypothetical protein
MDEADKIQALPLSVVRERLLNMRHDGFVMAHRLSNSVPAPGATAPPAKQPAAAPPPEEQKICAYSKCGVKFKPRRVDQIYHTPDCRKRAWFERNFAPIAKPEGGA